MFRNDALEGEFCVVKAHQTIISKEQQNPVFHVMPALIISEYLHNMLHLFIDFHFLSRSQNLNNWSSWSSSNKMCDTLLLERLAERLD